MRHRRSLVHDTLACLILTVCLLRPTPLFAALDPFGQPDPISDAPAAQNGERFAELVINGQPQGRLVRIDETGDRVRIWSTDAEAAGLAAQGGPPHFVDLDGLAGVTYRYDPLAGRLILTIPRKSDGPNAINLLSGRRATGEAAPMLAFLANYDLSVGADWRGAFAAGLVEGRIVRETISLDSGWRFDTRHGQNEHELVRLDAALTIALPKSSLRATLGDYISAGPASVRPVRMAGIQLTTDFALRPDIVTYPLPDFAGNVAVPTGLDLIVNDRRFQTGDIEPGDFTVRNIPVPVGRNQVGVVIRDALGRERVQTVELYSSRALLAPGLSVSAFNLGAIRRGYGLRSNDYGALGFSAMHRRSLGNGLTAELSVEATKGLFNAGASATFTLGSLGLATVDYRRSHFNGQDGSLASIALESLGSPLSVRLKASKASRGYEDLASASGDRKPESVLLAGLSFDLRDLGNVQANAVRQTRYLRPSDPPTARKVDIVSLSYRKSFASRLNLFLDASYQKSDRKSVSLVAGLSISFGARTNAQAVVSRQGGKADVQAGIYHPDRLPGDFGYLLQGGTGFADRATASVSYRGDWGRVEARSEMVNGKVAVRAGSAGSLIWADKHLFAAERVSSAFAVVRTGDMAGIGIERENRAVGKTGKSGRKLLTDIVPYVPTRIGIDSRTLPDNSLAKRQVVSVIVPDKAGGLVDLNVEHYLPAMVQLRDGNGALLASGSSLTGWPSRGEYIVGFDGLAEINLARGDSELRDAQGCRFAIDPKADVQLFAEYRCETSK